jgi:hypothetical protein
MPSSRAASAPSTATGSLAVAALRYLPWAMEVPATAGRPRVAASTLRPLVSTGGMSGDLYALTPLTVPVSCTAVAPGSRAIMPCAANGRWRAGR